MWFVLSLTTDSWFVLSLMTDLRCQLSYYLLKLLVHVASYLAS